MKTIRSDYNPYISKFETFLSVIIPISFLFMQYPFAIRTVSITCIFIMSLLCRIKYKDISLGGPLLSYTLFLFFRLSAIFTTTEYHLTRGVIILLITVLISGFSVTSVSKHIDISIMYKTWKILAYIVCIAVIIQSIQVFVLGQSVHPIKFWNVTASSNQILDTWNTMSSRPCAFFTEPAVVVSFLSPVLALALPRKEFKTALLLTICCLLTTSTSAIIVLCVIWSIYVISSDYSQKIKVSMMILLVLAALLIYVLPIFGSTMTKLELELSGSSTNMFGRVYSGWLVFIHLNPIQQLVGINHYDISEYIHNSSWLWAYVSQIRTAEKAAYFFNTAQRIALMTGIVGIVIYFRMLLRLIKSVPRYILPYLVSVIAVMFFESNFYNSNFFTVQYIVILTALYSKTKFDLEDSCN